MLYGWMLFENKPRILPFLPCDQYVHLRKFAPEFNSFWDNLGQVV